MATLEKLQARIAQLQAQADVLVEKQSIAVLTKIRDLMVKHDITVTDIERYIGGKMRHAKGGGGATGKAGASVKYRDPMTGATWTGHGRAPAWILGAEDRTRFLVDDAALLLAGAGSETPKAGNYVRGRQAPKYRDIGSGATWSGRGRAPAWIAGVKDRSKFLITSAEGRTEEMPFLLKKAVAETAMPAVVKRKGTVAKTIGATTRKTVVEKTVAKSNTLGKKQTTGSEQNPASAKDGDAGTGVSA